VIEVENTGDRKIDEVEVVDVVPSALEILAVSSNGNVEGQRVSWAGFALAEGESMEFFIEAKVKAGTSNGHVLANTVKAKSEDEGISASDTDTTVVETSGEVKAAVAEPAPVPITAATGANFVNWFGWIFGLLTIAG